MTEYAVGQTARTLVEITDDYHRQVIPQGEKVQVIGFAGKKVIVVWEDKELGKTVDATVDPWELRRMVG